MSLSSIWAAAGAAKAMAAPAATARNRTRLTTDMTQPPAFPRLPHFRAVAGCGSTGGCRKSAGEAVIVEEGLFLGRGCAPEHRIAVREAPEAPDDIGVQFRPAQEVSVAECAHQFAGAVLIGK